MPKPVLSDSLFNADNVATSVLAEANLQVANSDLGVTDITSSFVLSTHWSSWVTDKCFYFNGFVFVQLNAYIHTSNSNFNTASTNIYTINNSDYFPNYEVSMNTTSHEGDTAQRIKITTSGSIDIMYPTEVGSDINYHIICNGWYRVN